MKFISPLLCSILFLMLSACEFLHSSTSTDKSNIFSSTQIGTRNMPTKSPMLNEILTSTKGLPPGISKDVSHIVIKYIPIGTSRKQAKEILTKMHQEYKEEGNFIYAGYSGKSIPMVPRPGVRIDLLFNQFNYLEKIETELTFQQ